MQYKSITPKDLASRKLHTGRPPTLASFMFAMRLQNLFSCVFAVSKRLTASKLLPVAQTARSLVARLAIFHSAKKLTSCFRKNNLFLPFIVLLISETFQQIN